MAKRDRRTEIMAAAERLFTSRRFHEITLDDVANEARVGKGTIYRYFRDKDDLFFRTATRGFEELCELLAAVPADLPFPEQLLQACAQVSAFFAARREWFRMMQSEDARMPLCRDELRRHWFDGRRRLTAAMERILARGMDEGAIRRDVLPEVLATLLLGMLRTRARELSDTPAEQRSLERVVDLFCHGASGTARPDASVEAESLAT